MSCERLTAAFDATIFKTVVSIFSMIWFLFSVEHPNMIKKVLSRAYKWGLTNKLQYVLLHCLVCMVISYFKATSYSSQCLHHLLSPIRKVSYRKRGHISNFRKRYVVMLLG